ncbi:MAG: hypothetical protein Q8O72_10710 [Bacteroidales bacterium]|nr:hypothetical protein [Bacteroidales bacterium]
MKALSAVILPQFEKKGDKNYIRYSESQLAEFVDQLTDYLPDILPSEEEVNYSHQQIVFDTIDRDKMIAQMITDRYPYDKQVALFANRDDGNAEHDDEFIGYQKFRAFAKLLVDTFIAAYE